MSPFYYLNWQNDLLYPHCFRWVSNRHNCTPGFGRSFDELMCLRNVVQRKLFCNDESTPACLQCLINSPSGFHLCLGRYIVATDKENSGINKDELPDWNFWRGNICGVRGDRPTLC